MLCVFLVVTNGYGLFMSLKHWERSCLHHSVAGRYRTIVSEYSALGDVNLNEERKIGRTQHLRCFPLLSKLPAHVLWPGLHAVIVLMSIALLL